MDEGVWGVGMGKRDKDGGVWGRIEMGGNLEIRLSFFPFTCIIALLGRDAYVLETKLAVNYIQIFILKVPIHNIMYICVCR